MGPHYELGDPDATAPRGLVSHRLEIPAVVLALVVVLSACGSSGTHTSSSSGSSRHRSSAPVHSADNAKPTKTNDPKTASLGGTDTTSSKASTDGPYDLSVNYTSKTGWSYSGTVSVPDYQASFSADTNSSPPGQAQFSASVQGPVWNQDTGIADDNSGRPNGPTLVVSLVLAWQLTPGSADVEPAACSTEGDESFEQITSGKQLGYPFAFDLVCDPPDQADNDSVSGETDALSQAKVQSLVSQLSSEPPTYVLEIQDSDDSDGNPCIVWFAPPDTLTEVSQSMIPSGSGITFSDCSKTTVSIAS